MQNDLIDCHCHSDNSFDADYPVREMADRAARLNLRALCITDHCDFYVPGYNMNETFAAEEGYKILDLTKSIPRSVDAVREIADDYPGLTLLAGVELGQAAQNISRAQELLSLREFDFILGSLHNLARTEDFYYIKYTDENTPEILARYFDELLETAELNMFDSLAHITYPLRYISDAGVKINLSDYYPKIDVIFKTVIKNGKAIEVNTSGLRDTIGEPLPGRELLMRYRALGGELVTVGSDSHSPDTLASGVSEVYTLLKECGFDKVTYFKSRKPQFIAL